MFACFTPKVNPPQEAAQRPLALHIPSNLATEGPLANLTSCDQTKTPTAISPTPANEITKPMLSDVVKGDGSQPLGKLSNLTFKSPRHAFADTLNAFAKEGYLIIKDFANKPALQQLKKEIFEGEMTKQAGLLMNQLDIELNEKKYTDTHEFGMALLDTVLPGLQPPENRKFFVVSQVMKRQYDFKNSMRIHKDPAVVHFLMPLCEKYLNTLCLTPETLKTLAQDPDFAYALSIRRVIHDEKTYAAMTPIQSTLSDIAVFPADFLECCQINHQPLDKIYPKKSLQGLWHATPSEEIAEARTANSESQDRYLLGISIQLKNIEPPPIKTS